MAASSSYMSYLMQGSTKLIDIVSYGDIGGEPEQLDTTTLSDKNSTSILGIQSADTITFEANYSPEDFAKLKALENTVKEYGVYLGATDPSDSSTYGSNGKFTFSGMLSVYKSGAGVNEVQRMQISIAVSSEIAFSAS